MFILSSKMRTCVVLFLIMAYTGLAAHQDDTQLRPFDLTPTGFKYMYPDIYVYFPPFTMMKTPRETNCDGKINGIPVDPMVYMMQFSEDSRDGCMMTLPKEIDIKMATVVVISRYFDFQTQNETRFEYEFNLSEMQDGTEVEFDWTSRYYVNNTKEKSGKVMFGAKFEMNSSKCVPDYVTVDFEGVNLTKTSADEADVEFHVDGNKHVDDRVAIKTKRTKHNLISSIEPAESLSQGTSGTRGLLYISGIFRIGRYLLLKAGINAGRQIYKLYNKYYLFPYGSFGMLEPVLPVVTIYQNQFNIIPCKTIGASQFGFNYTPYLLKLVSPLNGTWVRPEFKDVRNILDLYIRERSAIISNTTENVDGTYACVLDYDKQRGNSRKRERQTIRREFKVVTKQ